MKSHMLLQCGQRAVRVGLALSFGLFLCVSGAQAQDVETSYSWSGVKPLVSPPPPESSYTGPVRVANDGAGKWVAVWHRGDDATSSGIWASRSTDNGVTWGNALPIAPTPETEYSPKYPQCNRLPDISTDGVGTWISVWNTGEKNQPGEVYFSRSEDDGTTFSAPQPLLAGSQAAFSNMPCIANDGAGNWVVAWSNYDFDLGSYLVQVSTSPDNGKSWDKAVTVGECASENAPVRIAADYDGNFIVVWGGMDTGSDSEILMSRSSDSGVKWSPPVVINSDSTTDTWNEDKLDISTDAVGNWIVAVERAGAIQTITSADNGLTWSAPLTVAAATSADKHSAPSVRSDQLGGWMLSWMDALQQSKPGSNILFSTSWDNGSSWTLAQTVNSDASPTMKKAYSNPAVGTDYQGKWMMFWNNASQVDTSPLYATAAAQVIGHEADMKVNLSVVPPDKATVGDILVWTLDVTNLGSSTASQVTVQQDFPTTMTILDVQCPQGAYVQLGSSLTFNLGSLAPSQSVKILMQTAASSIGNAIGDAAVRASETDPDLTNNQTSASLQIVKIGDLSITKAVDLDVAWVGDEVTWTIKVNNGGPSSVGPIYVLDTLPASVIPLDATIDATGAPAPTLSGKTVLFEIPRMAPLQAPVTITISALTVIPGSLVNTARVYTSDAFDPDMSNNTARVQSSVVNVPWADCSVDMNVVPTLPVVGDTLTWTATVTNHGPSRATAVTATQEIPNGVTLTQVQCSQGTFTQSGTTLNYSLGDMAVGQSVVLTMRATANRRATASSRVTVMATEPDPFSANDSVVSGVYINNSSDLVLTQSVSPQSMSLGNAFSWTLNVTNQGPATATTVRLVDWLPAAATFVSATASQGRYVKEGRVLTFEVGDLAPGQSAAFTINATANSFGELRNTPTVSSVEVDPNPANNSSTVSAYVGGGGGAGTALLSISMVDLPDPVKVGDQLTYAITVSNWGSVSAERVAVDDLLPTTVECLGVTPSQGTSSFLDATRHQVHCDLGTLAGGTSATISVVVKPTVAGQLVTTATVTSTSPDPNPYDDTVSVETTVNTTGGGGGWTSGADLTVAWLKSSARYSKTRRGTTCKLSGRYKVSNVGIETVTTKTVVRFYLSDDLVLDPSDRVLGSKTVSTVRVKGSVQGSFQASLPAGVTATGKYLVAVVDADGLVAEPNEQNNAVAVGPLR